MGKWDFLKPYDEQVQSALAARGVKEAFEVLLEGYHQVVVQYCTTLLDNEAEGEDVAHEVFLAIWRALPRYEPRALLRTWIFSIARKKCFKYREKLWNRARILLMNRSIITRTTVSDPPPSSEKWVVITEEAVHTQDQLKRLPHCLRQLPKGDRALIMMFYYEEISLREMARRLWQPEAAVRRTVHKVERRLRECVAQGEAV